MQENSPSSKPAILLVDDCTDTLMMMKLLFESSGAQVFTAESGPQALELMKSSNEGKNEVPHFYLVALDIRMPQMEGYDLAKHIRDMGFQGKIVALTANATGQGREQSEQSGIDVYLGKNIVKKEVIKALVEEIYGST